MLVLSRREGETVNIGDNVKVTVVAGRSVRIGIDAPQEIRISRSEGNPVDEREALLEAIAVQGSRFCCYAPGGLDPEAWPDSTCDCKFTGFGDPMSHRGSEQTGRCEMREAYRMVKMAMAVEGA